MKRVHEEIEYVPDRWWVVPSIIGIAAFILWQYFYPFGREWDTFGHGCFSFGKWFLGFGVSLTPPVVVSFLIYSHIHPQKIDFDEIDSGPEI